MNHLANLTDQQLITYVQKKMPLYRKMISRFQSFIKNFRTHFIGTAATDTAIDVSGGGGKLRVEDFKSPNFKTLKRHLSVISDSDEIDDLEYVVERLNASESASVRKEATRIRGVLNALIDRFNEALDVIEEVANKHIPQPVANYFRDGTKALNKYLSEVRRVKVDLQPMVLVGSAQDKITFVAYYDLSEYVSKPIWVHLSATMDVAAGSVFVREIAIKDRLRPPFKFVPEELPKSRSLDAELRRQLAAFGVAQVFSAVELKFDTRLLEKNLKGMSIVKGVQISDTEIRVKAPETSNTSRDIFAVISADPEVRTLLRRKHKLTYSYDGSDKSWVFTLRG